MKFVTRNRPAVDVPGVRGTARVDRRTRALLPRVGAGDIAVMDHVDLDRAIAQELVDRGVAVVLNASPMISGRFPSLGPKVLADAGVTMVDELGEEIFGLVRDGDELRVDDASVHTRKGQELVGRHLTAVQVDEQLADAAEGLGHQLDSFTHNSTEFLRREQELLLHGQGVPTPTTPINDRPVVVVVAGEDYEKELAAVKRFIVEQKPVLVGVDRAADAMVKARLRPDVVVISANASAEDLPAPRTLKAARDVVLLVDRGAPRTVEEPFARMGVQPLLFTSSATTEDAALILADAGEASVIVGVGMHATLADFLDRQRAGLASTYLTRLKVGPRLVDAAAVPTLYSGRVRPRHLAALFLAGCLALAAAIGTTPVGQDWADRVGDQSASFIDTLQGKFS